MSNEDPDGFKCLIEAFTIFRKYGTSYAPIHCEHDVMTVCCIEPVKVSVGDIARLEELGFDVCNEYGEEQFHSFRFGSA